MQRVDTVDEWCYGFVGDHGPHSTVTYHEVAVQCRAIRYSVTSQGEIIEVRINLFYVSSTSSEK